MIDKTKANCSVCGPEVECSEFYPCKPDIFEATYERVE